MPPRSLLPALAAAFLALAPPLARAYEPNWASLDARPLPAWYDEAKVGVFIVGGVFSVPSWGTPSGGASGEWFEEEWLGANGKPGDPAYAEFMRERYGPSFTYADFAPALTYDLFNATAWADLFVKAGVKYTVFLTKHHDGFTLWPSETSFGWNSVDVGPHRDVTGEVSAAAKAAGLHSGLYHSLFEWRVQRAGASRASGALWHSARSCTAPRLTPHRLSLHQTNRNHAPSPQVQSALPRGQGGELLHHDLRAQGHG
jgi:alpha-L-fucosidase